MKKKIIVVLIIIAIGLGITYVVLNYNKENTNHAEETETPSPASNSTSTPIPTPKPSPTPITNVQNMTEQEKSIFNAKFNIYIGRDISAKNVKHLISAINHSNETTSIRKVDLIINDEIATDSSKINASSTYTVNFEYDDNKLVCKAIVTENK